MVCYWRCMKKCVKCPTISASKNAKRNQDFHHWAMPTGGRTADLDLSTPGVSWIKPAPITMYHNRQAGTNGKPRENP